MITEIPAGTYEVTACLLVRGRWKGDRGYDGHRRLVAGNWGAGTNVQGTGSKAGPL
jgi:hypothetical protein